MPHPDMHLRRALPWMTRFICTPHRAISVTTSSPPQTAVYPRHRPHPNSGFLWHRRRLRSTSARVRLLKPPPPFSITISHHGARPLEWRRRDTPAGTPGRDWCRVISETAAARSAGAGSAPAASIDGPSSARHTAAEIHAPSLWPPEAGRRPRAVSQFGCLPWSSSVIGQL